MGSSAFAADMAVKAPVIAAPVPFSWTGIYFGATLGGGWGSEDPTDINSYGDTEAGTSHLIPHSWAYGVGGTPLLGFTLDLNYQVGWLVVGLEGQGGYMHLSGSGADPLSPGLDVVSSSEMGDWYWFAGGIAGVAWDRVLFYGKGGWVFTHASANVVDSCSVGPCGALTIAATGNTNGATSWAAGGGIAYAFNANWSARLEYMYWNLNNNFNATGTASNGFVYNWSHTFSGLQTVTLGLGYTFNLAQ